jgi:Lon protease-like protein
MNDEDSLALGDFDGTVRLFPLPNVVLFPMVVLPLHIFEPRYRQMTTDALKGDRLLAMALLESEEDAPLMAPPLHPVVCVGRILLGQRLEDGRFNLILRGLSRARLVRELPCEKLYRCARVELLKDSCLSPSSAELPHHKRLEALAQSWFDSMGVRFDEMSKLIAGTPEIATLVDILSFTLPLDIRFKQELLSELDVARRLSRLLDYLETQEPPKIVKPAEHDFPPRFSDN